MTEMKTWTWEERTAWSFPMPAGPWDGEPDKAQWIDEETGLDCLIVRARSGALCGYVGVTEAHPWHGMPYNDCMDGCDTHTFGERMDGMHAALKELSGCALPVIPDSMKEQTFTDCWDHSPSSKVEVHGGLTYSGFCQENVDEGEGICHIPAPGRPANVFWFGFDCSHLGDLSPGDLARAQEEGFQYPFTDPRARGEEYRDMDYVKAEVTRLAKQLKEVA